MGNSETAKTTNETFDSLCWTFDFQRETLTRFFEFGTGIIPGENMETIKDAAQRCLDRHLVGYTGGSWGIKTCASMFFHHVYRFLFPGAKYIYLVRDGRDVTLSHKARFHLTNPYSRHEYWDYFKILTFGISNDADSCPFPFPEHPHEDDDVMKHRYWIQAKSWCEHVRMMEHLKKTGALSDSVFTLKYEDLCQDTTTTLIRLFEFLAIDLDSDLLRQAEKFFTTKAIGRWKQYGNFVDNTDENIEEIFYGMERELRIAGYS